MPAKSLESQRIIISDLLRKCLEEPNTEKQKSFWENLEISKKILLLQEEEKAVAFIIQHIIDNKKKLNQMAGLAHQKFPAIKT